MAKMNVTSSQVGDHILFMIEKATDRKNLYRDKSEDPNVDDFEHRLNAIRMADAMGFLHGLRQLSALYSRLMEDDLK